MSKPIKSFEQVIGHKNTIRFIQEQINRNMVQNAILLTGNPGLGKTSIAKLICCHVAAGDDKKLLDRLIKEVIIEKKSNEIISIIEMTEVADKEEEIAKVKSQLSLGFSAIGKKFIIIDEVHGMTKKAQDGLLPELEHLDNGVYVIACTTDVSKLQDAFLSRFGSRFTLHNLNRIEIAQLIRSQIEYKKLKFAMNMDTVITLIGYYSNYQARDVVKLLDNFEDNANVSTEDLSVFINAESASVAIQLVNYLYGSLTLGLDYINTMEIDNVFAETMSEILKVAMGGKSKLLTPKEEGTLFNILHGKDINVLVHFTVDILSYGKVSQKQLMSVFIKHNQALLAKPKVADTTQIYGADLTAIEYAAEATDRPVLVPAQESAMRAETLEEILSRADTILGG